MPDATVFWSDDRLHPCVDRKVLDEAAELYREVEQLGSGDQSSYRIAPALGGTVIGRKTGTANTGARSPFSSVLARGN